MRPGPTLQICVNAPRTCPATGRNDRGRTVATFGPWVPCPLPPRLVRPVTGKGIAACVRKLATPSPPAPARARVRAVRRARRHHGDGPGGDGLGRLVGGDAERR